MILLQKTNKDWWSVRQSTGQEGYVPANYVKEVEPKIVQKMVKRPVKVQERVKVIKTGMRKEPMKREKKLSGGSGAKKLRRTPSGEIILKYNSIWAMSHKN